MTHLVDAVKLAVGADAGDAGKIANAVVLAAIKKIGRMPSVDFNKQFVSFALTAGQKTYQLGRDVLANASPIWNMQDMWLTDKVGWGIEIVGAEEFNANARGGTATGAPTIATIYGPDDSRTLEVYPSPDSAYNISAMAKLSITQYGDIPSRYDDVVLTTALSLLNSLRNPSVALAMMKEGLGDIRNDRVVSWSGSHIGSIDEFGYPDHSANYDTGSLR